VYLYDFLCHMAVLHPLILIREYPMLPLLEELDFMLQEGVDLERLYIFGRQVLPHQFDDSQTAQSTHVDPSIVPGAQIEVGQLFADTTGGSRLCAYPHTQKHQYLVVSERCRC